jgi:hypothetical protein
MLDGVYNMDSYQGTASPFPNPDATQEFSVISNNFDAKYGFSAGGVVSIVTKSGTNNWHGNAFEFMRNGAVNATDYFTHQSDKIHRNQFGGSLGGPIVKDKLFIFGNYQATIGHFFTSAGGASGASVGSVYVPSVAMKSGDFSALCLGGFTNGLCNDRDDAGNVLNQIWKPLLVPDHNADHAIADPSLYFADNFVDPDTYFNPGTRAIAALLPDTTDRLGHLITNGFPQINDFNEGTARVDYNPSEHHRISGRLFLNFFNQPAYSSEDLISTNRSWIVDWQNYGGNWTWTINPHMVNSVNGTFARMFSTSNSGLKIDGQPVCYSQFSNVHDGTAYAPCGIEYLQVSGGPGPGFGIGQNYNAINRRTWGVSDTLSISKGKHLIAAGVDTLRNYILINTNYFAEPLIAFQGGPNGNFTGYGFSDFLMGQESLFIQGGGSSIGLDAWLIAPFVSDQIKITPRLTVTAGVRWEPFTAPVAQAGRCAEYWPGHQSTRYPNAPNGVLFPGDAGIEDGCMPSDYNVFNPRVGVAWQPSFLPNTSIRAAFGIFSQPLEYNDWNHMGNNAPFGTTYQFSPGNIINGQTIPIIPFSDPWSVYEPTNFTSPFPPFDTPGYVPPPDLPIALPYDLRAVTQVDKPFKQGRTQSWNLSVEHQFGPAWLVRAAYVGSQSYHQGIFYETNPGQFFCGPVGPGCAPEDFAKNGTRLDPTFTEKAIYTSEGTASYHSGQFTLERRFRNGLQFTANYAHSRTTDLAAGLGNVQLNNPLCVPCNRGRSVLDVPDVFTAHFLYQTPSLSGMNGAARGILGGWQVSGIYRAQSGYPFTVISGFNRSYTLISQGNGLQGTDHVDFANADGSFNVHPGNLDHYIDSADFAQPAYGSQGNTPRSLVYGPGINTWDLGLTKNFSFRERYRFQFRWEMFNAFNHASFGVPDYNLSSGTFGKITRTGSIPARTMQAALKFSF